jgi:PBSX family phage terminase large subunit
MIYQKLSKRQLLAATWWNRPRFRDREAIICDGAVRSGKTVCMADGFFLWSMSQFDGQTFGICGKTIASLRRNIVMKLPDWLEGTGLQLIERRGENKIIVTCGNRTNTYFLFGGQDESSYMLIQGITLAGVLLDEVALMPRSFVEQACARCSVPGSKLWFNCNPEGPQHWFYKEWILKCKEKNALHVHFTMADNLALDPQIRRRYETLYSGVFYRRYILGEWCVAEGLVYQFDKDKHVTKIQDMENLEKYGRWYISVDYGTLNPFSAGLWCMYEGRAIRVKEYYYSGRSSSSTLTDEEYYAELEKLAGKLDIQAVVVDPSAASFIATIRRHGRFSVRKAKNNVLPGIRITASLLKAGLLQIDESCEDTIREFGLYRWDDKGETDRVIKENDHAMDDIRYFCATVVRRDLDVQEQLGGANE